LWLGLVRSYSSSSSVSCWPFSSTGRERSGASGLKSAISCKRSKWISQRIACASDARSKTSGAREQERAYLLSLREEFAEAESQVPESIAERASALHAHEALIRQTQGQPRDPADSLLFWMSLLSYPVTFDPPQAVFDAGGGTQLIRSDPLRVALARYSTRLARLGQSDANTWSTWEQRLQPYLEGRVPRIDRIMRGAYGALNELPFTSSDRPIDFADVLGDPAFQDRVAERWLRLSIGSQEVEALQEVLDAIVGLIDLELEGRE
jgi:hypothetical protein